MTAGRGQFLGALLALALASCSGGTPSVIRDEWRASPSGVVTIVFFTDFECPFCRRTHAALDAALADHPGPVRVVIRHVPLAIHPDADGAARASICMADQVAMTNALYAAENLSEHANEELAVQLGADRDTYRACVVAPATTKRIAHDVAMMDAVKGDGVPLLYVGSQRLDGAQSTRALADAIRAERAERLR